MLQLFAQAADVDIHRAVVAGVGEAPDEIHQILARVYAVGILDEQLQNVVFLRRQIDRHAVAQRDAPLGVERDAAGGQKLRALLRGLARAAQQSADARLEL